LLTGLTVAHMVNDFYTMILPPLIPALRVAFGMNYLRVGLLSFCFYILSGVLQPTVGHLADTRGTRKKTIIGGFLIFCAGFVAMGLSPTYAVLLGASLLCGLGAATFHPQSTNFLTRAFPETRGRAMGIHGWGGSIGNFLAPLVVAFLVTQLGWRPAVVCLVVPGLLVAGFLAGLLDEPTTAHVAGRGWGLSRELLLLCLTFALLSMVLRGFLTFLPTFLVERGASLPEAGFFTSVMLFVGLIAQPLGGHAYDKVGGRWIFLVASVGTSLGLVLFTASAGFMLVLGAVLVGFFIFTLFPVSLAMGSEVATGDRVGVSVGLVFGVSSTFSALTPIVTGYVADLFGLTLAFQLLIALALGAAFLSLSLPARGAGTLTAAVGARER
jgi:FSR family fosmidomycin resistance protein-like MFS transporter